MSVEQQLTSIQRTLLEMNGRLGKIEGLAEGAKDEAMRIAGYAASNSQRIGKLEQAKAKLLGVAAAVSAIVALLFKSLPFLLGK